MHTPVAIDRSVEDLGQEEQPMKYTCSSVKGEAMFKFALKKGL